jgi:uncharacterized protein (TIGR02147 family)
MFDGRCLGTKNWLLARVSGLLSNEELEKILLSSQSGQEALVSVYQAAKTKLPAFSLSLLGRKAGISSKGYLSDVFKGRRQLNRSYWHGMADALGLSGLNRQYLFCLLHLDVCEDEICREQFLEQKCQIEKSFAVQMYVDPTPLRDQPFAFELFAAFGLFASRPSRDELVRYFGRERFTEVDSGLSALTQAGLIRRVEDRYECTSEHIVFSSRDSDAQMSHLDFLRGAILEAGKNADKWYGRKDSAYFEASIISASQADYAKKLQTLKDLLLKWQSDLESADADLLIRFNVQIYPLGDSGLHPKSAKPT